jgi:glycogen synthase
MREDPSTRERFRLALCAWEIGRIRSGFGAKVGGLGAVLEELPAALAAAAARRDLDLAVDVLSPCFAHYDRSRLVRETRAIPVSIEGHRFSFEVFTHRFEETFRLAGEDVPFVVRAVYFWDPGQLHWTAPGILYPTDPWLGAKLHAAVSQAMAGWIAAADYDTVHLHDYHVGLVPFYLDPERFSRMPVHLTIHNATYQGVVPLIDGGFSTLDRLNLPGERLFHRYFDHFDRINLLKAAVLRVHELGGRVTTVSGDLEGTWGYAAELRESAAVLRARAAAQKGEPPTEVFVPNRFLDVLEKIPVAGITNGLDRRNRPEHLPELRAEVLRRLRDARGPGRPLFRNPDVEAEMLARDHTFSAGNLEPRETLRRLLYLEAFDHPIWGYPILFTAVGRLVEQKNLGLVADVADRVFAEDPQVRFVVVASAPDGDAAGKATEGRFRDLELRYPGRFRFLPEFDPVLSRLVLADGDFCLVPSRFEPCGLVDYEASLLGTIVVGRRTGGLAKVADCAWLYDWLDTGDTAGEARAFLGAIRAAVGRFRFDPDGHRAMMHRAMTIDASWNRSADAYLDLYEFGRTMKGWKAERSALLERFAAGLGHRRRAFDRFFAPGYAEYGDWYDWDLRATLDRTRKG